MRKIKILKDQAYVIAEIGHNHQGNLDQAKKLFLMAKNSGANAVKLQKRDNKSLYTKNFYNSPYDNPNSYGPTYGLHREKLEFDKSQFKDLQEYASEIEIDFFSTAFDFKSVEFLDDINVPAYKIASADLKNIPLQKEIAKRKKKIFLSTGGGSIQDVQRAVDNITQINSDLVIMQCIASYPAQIKDLNLNVIKTYKKLFPNHLIGLSDHENGIDAGPIAYMLGARVFEKHVTLDRSLKGTDHPFSLEPVGFEKFIRNLRRIPQMLGSSEKQTLDIEKKALFKMEKSIVAKKNLKKGDKLILENLDFKSPGGGLPPSRLDEVLNKVVKYDIKEDEYIEIKKLQ